ncbi:hypothetical protein N0V88_004690 [Collariella sp. IMI 366227]|nr:hypothetical protein N0V88_004690 [Collariella sp. IMI 366227]
MRVSDLSLLLAAAGTQVAAQATSSTSSAAPSSTVSPGSETGKLGDAEVVANNPPGVVYRATLPESAFFKPAYPNGGNIKGEVSAVANPDGAGVLFNLKLSNLPKIGAPLPYHLHVAPVPDNGNCTATLAHLDPYIRGEATSCNFDAPETCQVGDLSGKHGEVPADQDSWETSYVDLYASTLEGIGAFFGNRSIVFHYPNKTRITCASFEEIIDDSDDDTSSSSRSPSGTAVLPTHSTSVTPTALPTTQGGQEGTATGSKPPGSTGSNVEVGAAAGLRASITGVLVLGAAALFLL